MSNMVFDLIPVIAIFKKERKAYQPRNDYKNKKKVNIKGVWVGKGVERENKNLLFLSVYCALSFIPHRFSKDLLAKNFPAAPRLKLTHCDEKRSFI